MGTSSSTRVLSGSQCLASVHRPAHGYPSGHGLHLAKFLKKVEFVGLSSFTAAVVAHVKPGASGIYEDEADAPTKADYDYCVTATDVYDGCIHIDVTVRFHGDVLFRGYPPEFWRWCKGRQP